MEIHSETSEAGEGRFHSAIHVVIDVCLVEQLYLLPAQVYGVSSHEYQQIE